MCWFVALSQLISKIIVYCCELKSDLDILYQYKIMSGDHAMSIFRCPKCGHIQETPQKYMDKLVRCPKCQGENRVVDTVGFIQKIISAYKEKQSKIATLSEDITKLQESISQSNKATLIAQEDIEQQKKRHQSQVEKLKNQIRSTDTKLAKIDSDYHKLIESERRQKERYKKEIGIPKPNKNSPTIDIADTTPAVHNISNMDGFAPPNTHQSIEDWFAKKSIQIDINMDAIDTKGFFDEVAIYLGNHFDILQTVLEQIRYIQRKGYDTVKIPLEKKTKEEILVISKFCKEIYEYSFAARSYHDKKKNAIYLEIQKATKIINFFNGMWMEWYIYMMILEFFKKRDTQSNPARGIKLTYPNRDKNELDIFFIADNTPICIECKSGEFRGDIDKYLKLKKRLNLTKEQFIICIIGVDDSKTDGLTSTYDITFKNQNNLLEHIDQTLKRAQENERIIAENTDKIIRSQANPITPRATIQPKKPPQKESGFLKGFMSSFKK